MRNHLSNVQAKRTTAHGSRLGTVNATKEQCINTFGPPHWTGNIDDKVTYSWTFATPRGPVEIRDYWWNGPKEQSIGSQSKKAALWVASYCRANGLPATTKHRHGAA